MHSRSRLAALSKSVEELQSSRRETEQWKEAYIELRQKYKQPPIQNLPDDRAFEELQRSHREALQEAEEWKEAYMKLRNKPTDTASPQDAEEWKEAYMDLRTKLSETLHPVPGKSLDVSSDVLIVTPPRTPRKLGDAVGEPEMTPQRPMAPLRVQGLLQQLQNECQRIHSEPGDLLDSERLLLSHMDNLTEVLQRAEVVENERSKALTSAHNHRVEEENAAAEIDALKQECAGLQARVEATTILGEENALAEIGTLKQECAVLQVAKDEASLNHRMALTLTEDVAASAQKIGSLQLELASSQELHSLDVEAYKTRQAKLQKEMEEAATTALQNRIALEQQLRSQRLQSESAAEAAADIEKYAHSMESSLSIQSESAAEAAADIDKYAEAVETLEELLSDEVRQRQSAEFETAQVKREAQVLEGMLSASKAQNELVTADRDRLQNQITMMSESKQIQIEDLVSAHASTEMAHAIAKQDIEKVREQLSNEKAESERLHQSIALLRSTQSEAFQAAQELQLDRERQARKCESIQVAHEAIKQEAETLKVAVSEERTRAKLANEQAENLKVANEQIASDLFEVESLQFAYQTTEMAHAAAKDEMAMLRAAAKDEMAMAMQLQKSLDLQRFCTTTSDMMDSSTQTQIIDAIDAELQEIRRSADLESLLSIPSDQRLVFSTQAMENRSTSGTTLKDRARGHEDDSYDSYDSRVIPPQSYAKTMAKRIASSEPSLSNPDLEHLSSLIVQVLCAQGLQSQCNVQSQPSIQSDFQGQTTLDYASGYDFNGNANDQNGLRGQSVVHSPSANDFNPNVWHSPGYTSYDFNGNANDQNGLRGQSVVQSPSANDFNRNGWHSPGYPASQLSSFVTNLDSPRQSFGQTPQAAYSHATPPHAVYGQSMFASPALSSPVQGSRTSTPAPPPPFLPSTPIQGSRTPGHSFGQAPQAAYSHATSPHAVYSQSMFASPRLSSRVHGSRTPGAPVFTVSSPHSLPTEYPRSSSSFTPRSPLGHPMSFC